LGTETAIAGALGMLAVILYAVLAGADFGGGVWDLLASGRRAVQQREAIGAAMGPVWETNHVWLIFLLVLVFTCFPPVFAKLGVALFVPLTLALLGIVLRGAAFAFRGPPYRDLLPHKVWGVVFGVASLATPFFFGASAAAIATGTLVLTRPMSIAVGLFAIALSAQLAGVYLTAETRAALRDDFRRRAYWATLVVAIGGLAALLIGAADAPTLVSHLRSPLSLAMIGGAMSLGLLVCVLLRIDQVLWARIAVAGEVAAVLCGWFAAQARYMLDQMGVAQPAAPQVTIAIFLRTSLFGAIVLVPSLLLLFAVFKRAPID